MSTGYTEAVRRADRLQTLDSAAAVLQMAPSTLRRWLRSGRIRGHALDTAPWCDVLDFTEARPATYFRVSEVLAGASRSR
jgi:predicted site-specific integrase-resolvase